MKHSWSFFKLNGDLYSYDVKFDIGVRRAVAYKTHWMCILLNAPAIFYIHVLQNSERWLTDQQDSLMRCDEWLLLHSEIDRKYRE